MNFEQAINIVLAHEGGFSDNSADPGNWTGGKPGVGRLLGTRYGISAAAYPDVDIPRLTIDQAAALYRRDYWDRLRLDEIPAALRLHVFDAAVNSGTAAAARWLQLAVGANPDGIIGPATLAAAQAADPARAVCRMVGARLLLLAGNANFATFGRGWVRRVAANLQGS